jgi:hypothetical protein
MMPAALTTTSTPPNSACAAATPRGAVAEGWPTSVSAIALKSALAVDPAPALSAAELPLLDAWLDRLAIAPSR